MVKPKVSKKGDSEEDDDEGAKKGTKKVNDDTDSDEHSEKKNASDETSDEKKPPLKTKVDQVKASDPGFGPPARNSSSNKVLDTLLKSNRNTSNN